MVVAAKRRSPFELLRVMLVVQYFAVMLACAWLWHTQSISTQKRMFSTNIDGNSHVIRRRLTAIENQLRSVSAFFIASNQVDKAEFAKFLDGSRRHDTDETPPGKMIKSWIWIASENNTQELSFLEDDHGAHRIIDQTAAIRSALDRIHKFGDTQSFSVPAAALGRSLAIWTEANLAIVQPVMHFAGRLPTDKRLRGYIIAVADLARLIEAKNAPASLRVLETSAFRSAHARVNLGSMRLPLPPFDITGATRIFEAQLREPLGDGKLSIDWRASYPSLMLPVTPARLALLAAFSCLTWFGWRMTQKLQVLHVSLEHERDRSQAAVTEKSQFLANMSHEIRTPLNAIMGMADLMRKGLLADKQRTYLNELHWSAQNLTKLIDSVLDFSKLEAKQVILDETANDLEKFFKHIANSVKPSLEAKGVSFIGRIDKSMPAMASFDALRYQQITLNLLTNATKFTNAGFVGLFVTRLEEPCDPGHFWMEIVVKDTGIGFRLEVQDKLFERFSQADNSTTRNYGGTGLGLAIVQELVALARGSIKVESELGRGTKFTIRLPMREYDGQSTTEPHIADANFGHPPAGQPIRCKPANQKRLQILVAEDDRVNRLYMKELLSSLGHHCTFANDGCVAIDQAMSRKFDLIFMDCQMPICDGYSATRSIRKNSEGTAFADVAIVALTAHALDGERQKCIDAGMNDFMTKPVREAELQAAIDKWASRPAANMATDPVITAQPIEDAAVETAALPTELPFAVIDAAEGASPGPERPAAPAVKEAPDAAKATTIDRPKIDELRATMGSSFATIIACLVEDLETYALSLDKAYGDARYEDARRVAHTLKSTSLLVGAEQLSQQARLLEALLAQIQEGTAASTAASDVVQIQRTMRTVAIELNTEVLAAAA